MILEEINVHEDTPDDVVHDLFTETLWPEHPLGRPILGTKREHRGRDARPGPAVLQEALHAGEPRSSSRRATSATRRCSSSSASGMEVGPCARPDTAGVRGRSPHRDGSAPAPSGRSLTKQARHGAGAHLHRHERAARNDPDRFAFGVVNAALGGGMSSRLFQEIREKRGLAYSAYSYHSQYAEAGLFCAYVGDDAGEGEGGRLDHPGPARGGRREGARARRVRPGQGTHEGFARPVARGPRRADVSSRQVGDRARRDPHA